MNDKQLYIDGNLMDLDSGTVVALTLKINDIGDVSTRQGNHTNKFKIPFTSRNNLLLNIANKVQSGSTKPYQKLSVKYVERGVELIPNGYCIVDTAKDCYEVTAYSGNSDFFDVIKGLKLQDLDLSFWSHSWALADILASFTNTSGYTYPIIDYNGTLEALAQANTIHAQNLYPSVFVHTLFEQIVKQAGWSLNPGDAILSDARYLGAELPFSKSKFIHANKYTDAMGVDAPAKIPHSFSVIHGSGSGTDIMQFKDTDTIVVDSVGNTTTYHNMISNNYIAPKAGLVDYNVTGTVKLTSGGLLISTPYSLDIVVKNITTGGIVTFPGVLDIEPVKTNQLLTFAVSIKMQGVAVGDHVEAYFAWSNSGGLNPFDYTITIHTLNFVVKGDDIIPFGYPFEITDVLPDMSQIEFMKTIMQMLAISPDAKSESQTLQLRSFGELLTNLPSAKQWGTKWVEQEPSINYRCGNYFQINDFCYNQDFGIGTLFGDGSFTIADTTLLPRGKVVSLPYGSSEESDQAYLSDAKGFFSVPAINNFLQGGTSQRILMHRPYVSLSNITITDGTTPTTVTAIPLCYFTLGGFPGLGWTELLTTYYTVIINLLQQFKKVTVMMKLSSVDVQNFDHFMPVYIPQLSANFYVNVNKNYKYGELTAVEIVRL